MRLVRSRRPATASAVFHFDENDEITRVTAERYRREDGAVAPWTGRFRDYEVRDGLRVPTRAAVAWNLPDGDAEYWRATVESVVHSPAARPETSDRASQ